MSRDFIEDEKLEGILQDVEPTGKKIDRIVTKSLNKNRLTLRETAVLLQAEKDEWIEKIFAGARQLKEKIYDDRVVLFSPLYIANKCINNCKYCEFRVDNEQVERKTLTKGEIQQETPQSPSANGRESYRS